jgi:hypothetical protein
MNKTGKRCQKNANAEVDNKGEGNRWDNAPRYVPFTELDCV